MTCLKLLQLNLPSRHIQKYLKKIDENMKVGLILFVVDKDLTLKGSISDGDIRRDILKKNKIKTKC